MENLHDQLNDIQNDVEILPNNENAVEVNNPIHQENEEIPVIEIYHLADDIQFQNESPEPEEPPYELINYQTRYNRARGSYTQTFRLVKVPVMHTELNPNGPEYEEQGCLYGCYKNANNKILSTDALTIMKSPLNDEKTVHLNYCSHTNSIMPIIKPKRDASREYIYTETRKLPKRKNLDENEGEDSNKRMRNN